MFLVERRLVFELLLKCDVFKHHRSCALGSREWRMTVLKTWGHIDWVVQDRVWVFIAPLASDVCDRTLMLRNNLTLWSEPWAFFNFILIWSSVLRWLVKNDCFSWRFIYSLQYCGWRCLMFARWNESADFAPALENA